VAEYAGDLTPEQTYAMLRSEPEAVLVDVRTVAEWSYVGLPDLGPLGKEVVRIEWVRFPDGAQNAGFTAQLIEAGVPASAPVAFLCRSGVRSRGAAATATAAGYGRAYNIIDGFEGQLDGEGHRGVGGWKAAGLPWRQT
jgi:rhodanese-related sulfurtransferase